VAVTLRHTCGWNPAQSRAVAVSPGNGFVVGPEFEPNLCKQTSDVLHLCNQQAFRLVTTPLHPRTAEECCVNSNGSEH
jgi:hypothetical protein